jgi:aerobic carbon-monoxide dehydrogenase small subunit
MKIEIKLNVNNEDHVISVEPRKLLIELLREDLGLLGTKEGCGTGDCGACTILINGEAVNSCLVLAVDSHGKQITTVEGLSRTQNLDPLQTNFIKSGAIQCGFCTPGMLMSAKAMLNENPNPTKNDIREAIAGNLCRCTGYHRIVQAIGQSALMEVKDHTGSHEK